VSAEGYIISGIVAVIVAYLGYLGIRDQNRTAKAGSDSSTQTTATTSALAAWETLLQPYRDEVTQLRGEVGVLRDEAGEAREREAERDRKIVVLTEELHRWQRVAKTIARWAVTMRDQLRGLGHEVPAEPDELMTLQIVSDVDDQNLL
jgi:hypothetical protein